MSPWSVPGGSATLYEASADATRGGSRHVLRRTDAPPPTPAVCSPASAHPEVRCHNDPNPAMQCHPSAKVSYLVRKNRFLARLTSAAVAVAAVTTTTLLIGEAASAATLPSTTIWQADGVTVTTTTLDVTPAGPADGNTVETLTATLNPTTAEGTVQFNDGSSTLGDPVTLIDGTASTTTSLPSGNRSLTAVFLPTDTTTYSGSTSNTVD